MRRPRVVENGSGEGHDGGPKGPSLNGDSLFDRLRTGFNEKKKDLPDAFAPAFNKFASLLLSIISTTCESLIGTHSDKRIMAHRGRKPCEPLGPVYLLRSVRDQVALFQEKRGITAEENNFVNLLAVMITQAGQAMYAVFTMFLALLPVATMFLHIAHFLLDRTLDLVTTRKRSDLMIKASIFSLQLIAIFFAVKFIMSAIFLPIFNMQTSILSKMFLFEDSSGMGRGMSVIPDAKSVGTFQYYICKPPIATVLEQPKSPAENFRIIKKFIIFMTALPALFVKI